MKVLRQRTNVRITRMWRAKKQVEHEQQLQEFSFQCVSFKSSGKYCIIPNHYTVLLYYNVSRFSLRLSSTTEKPSKLQLEVPRYGKRSASISFEVPLSPGQGSVREVLLSYACCNGSVWKEALTVPFASPVTHKLQNLRPFTLYTVNVTVTNEYFTSDGQRKNFTTWGDGKLLIVAWLLMRLLCLDFSCKKLGN